MKYLNTVILFLLVANSTSFCDELFTISDYYNIGSENKIIRYAHYQYNGDIEYTYVLSLYEDDKIGIEISYRSGNIYLICFYKNNEDYFKYLKEVDYITLEKLYFNLRYVFRYSEQIDGAIIIFNENTEYYHLLEETNNVFESIFYEVGSQPNDFVRGNYIRDKIKISGTSNYYFTIDISSSPAQNIRDKLLLSELEVQFPLDDEILYFVFNASDDIILIKKMFEIAEENGLR